VETGQRRRTIEVRRSGPGWAVKVDGRAMWVDLARVDDRWSMLVRSVENQPGPPPFENDPTSRHGDSYEFAIERQARGKHIVRVAGHVVPVTLLVPGRGRSGAGTATAKAVGPIEIVSPMPGRIVKVLVKAGDAVVARQGLVVVEAMKMENELRAPRAGTVADVRVREGAPVEANVVLVVLT
jgi:biotin carboxyl carrier protein